MKHWIALRAKETPDKVAIIHGNIEMTYSQLYNEANQYAHYFKYLNEERVAIYIKNDIHHIALILGAWLAEVELVMINTKLTNKEIENQLMDANVQTLISYNEHDLKQRVILINNILMNNFEYTHHDNDLNMDKIATIMFTSGTTGPAKAVPQTFLNHYYSAIGCRESLGFNKRTVWLSVLPIYHISGLSVLIRSLIEGFTIMIEPKFDVNRVLQIIRSEKITHISLVPQTLQWLLDNGLEQPYRLEKILLGGAKLSSSMIEEALKRNLPIYNSFGMTETCSQFVTASPNMLVKHPNTVGKPAENVKIKILNADKNGHGEIALKGSNVMNGYLNIKNEHFEDGYFKTGDIGSIDHEGYVYIYDRRKDLIISGGENIYPYEIENLIIQHTNIKSCAVVPIHDVKWGQIPVLVYEKNQRVNRDEIKEILVTRLAKFKHPKYFLEIEEIPRTSTGKISRHKVKVWVENELK